MGRTRGLGTGRCRVSVPVLCGPDVSVASGRAVWELGWSERGGGVSGGVGEWEGLEDCSVAGTVGAAPVGLG